MILMIIIIISTSFHFTKSGNCYCTLTSKRLPVQAQYIRTMMIMIVQMDGKSIFRCDTMNERVHTIHERGIRVILSLSDNHALVHVQSGAYKHENLQTAQTNLHNIRNVLIRTFDVHLRARIPFVHVHIPSYISYLTLSTTTVLIYIYRVHSRV